MKCLFCGYEGNQEDFEQDYKHHAGAWCPTCDAFTLYNMETEKSRIFTLYLEDVEMGELLNSRKKIGQYVSPLRYPGGKSKLIPYMAAILPKGVTRIVEPFCGGGSISLSLLLAGQVNSIVLNDADINVYALFRTILFHPMKLIERIENALPDRDTYFLYRKSLLGNEFLEEPERAFRFLYCNRLAFSGILFSNPMRNISARWNPEKLKRKILKIWECREQIEIYNLDAKVIIETEYWCGPGTMIFIDPPYFRKGPALYKLSYQQEEHQELSWLVESLYREVPGAHIIITYDNAEQIENMYCVPEIKIIKSKYCIAN